MANQGKHHGYMQDLRALYKTIISSTDEQAQIISVSDRFLELQLTPKQGINAHATFIINMTVPSDYPRTSPEVSFCTPIFHPNIDISSGDVCVSILSDWNNCYSLLDVVKALLFLIENPNFDSANNHFGELSNVENLKKASHRLLAGLKVKGRSFPPNESWCVWAKTNNCFPSDGQIVENSMPEPALPLQPTLNDKVNAQIEEPEDDFSVEDLSDQFGSDSLSSSWCPPSVANVRHSVGSEQYSGGRLYYINEFDNFYSQRILIRSSDQKLPSIFYYCEYIGERKHRHCLGRRYNFLLSGNYQSEQPVCSSPQRVTFRPWFPFTPVEEDSSFFSYKTPTDYECFSLLFREPTLSLTHDFLPFSSGYLLARFFALARQHKEKPELDILSLGDIFTELEPDANELAGTKPCIDPASSESDTTVKQDDNLVHKNDDEVDKNSEEANKDVGEVDKGDKNVALSGNVNDVGSKIDVDNHNNNEADELGDVDGNKGGDNDDGAEDDATNGEKDENGDDAVNRENGDSLSLENIASYASNYSYNRDYQACSCCTYLFVDTCLELREMLPRTWVFAQTRWPPLFAPQQIVDLSLRSEIKTPPWRVSVGQLFHDVCTACDRNPAISHLLLLDPMALSCFSPLVNLMQRVSSDQLTSVLWLTPYEALSPSSSSHISIPKGVRFVTLMAFLSNYLSWFSRMEVYASLGASRCRSDTISDALAACCLQPTTLGCGQAPLFDIWPLWTLRLVSRSICPLLTRLLVMNDDTTSLVHCLFPFSDLDEV